MRLRNRSRPLFTQWTIAAAALVLIGNSGSAQAATTAPIKFADGGHVVWRGDPLAGRAQWSSMLCEDSSRITNVIAAGRHAYRMEVDDDDDVTGERCEMGQDDNRTRSFYKGNSVWEGYSFLMPANFPTHSKWTTVTQWKDQDPDQGSPIWGTYIQDGQIQFAGETQDDPAWVTTATTNVWHNMVVHMVVSDPGLLQIYYSTGNAPLRLVFSGKTDNYRSPSRLVPRMGYYRDPDISTNNAVYFSGWTIGTSLGSANPLNRR